MFCFSMFKYEPFKPVGFKGGGRPQQWVSKMEYSKKKIRIYLFFNLKIWNKLIFSNI